MFEVLGFLGVILPFLDFRAQCLCLPLEDDWLPYLRHSLGQDVPRFGSPLTKAEEGALPRRFITVLLSWTCGLGRGGGGPWEIPERLIDLVQKE